MVSGYKIVTQKSIVFLHSGNKKHENDTKKLRKWFYQKEKYLGINLGKVVQDLYIENYKTLLREIKEHLNKRWDSLCSWIERLNIIKMPLLHKLMLRFNTILIKTPAGFFL